MHEVISIFVGHTGAQLAAACWQLFSLEHSIGLDGIIPLHKYRPNEEALDDHVNTLFEWRGYGRYEFRFVFIDCDSSALDELRSGPLRRLFHPENTISGKESAITYIRGRTAAKELEDKVTKSIRRMADKCCSLQGFLVFHSLGGGTGSGLTSWLLEHLNTEYSKSKASISVFPSSQLSTSVVEPYNAVLAAHMLLENADLSFVFDNVALYDICKSKLTIDRPTHRNINHLIAQAVSNITCEMRYGNGNTGNNLNDLGRLVPYPRVHFLTCSQSPIGQIPLSVSEMAYGVLESSNCMAKCNPCHGRFMGIHMMYRGDVPVAEVSATIKGVRSTVDFVDWSPAGFFTSVNNNPLILGENSEGVPIIVERSVTMLANTTSISNVFERINDKFDLLYSKRTHVHWFTQGGMEAGLFVEAREDLAALQQDYWEINDTGENELMDDHA